MINITNYASQIINKTNFYFNRSNSIISNMQNVIPYNYLVWTCIILIIILGFLILILKFKNHVDSGINIFFVILAVIIVVAVLYLFFKDTFISFFS